MRVYRVVISRYDVLKSTDLNSAVYANGAYNKNKITDLEH
jgi:hypothetical protein